LILTRDSILEYLGEVTVAPVTTTVRDIPSEVPLSRQDGMQRDCAVNCDHIQTVSKGKIGAVVTNLSPARMKDVTKAVGFALNLW
jgi:mRNA interferase MazF